MADSRFRGKAALASHPPERIDGFTRWTWRRSVSANRRPPRIKSGAGFRPDRRQVEGCLRRPMARHMRSRKSHAQSQARAATPPAARRGGDPPDLPARARGDQARRLAGRRLRRGRAGAARRPGRRGGRHPRSQARSARPRRFQEARRRKRARSSMPRSAPAPRSAVAFGAARAHRPRQYPAGLAVGAGARGGGAAGPAQARVRRRPRPHRGRLRLRGGDQRRRHHRVDRGGLDRRQGHARPADGPARPAPSGLRLRAAQGLQRAGALRGADAARSDHPSSPLVRAGRRRLWRSASPRSTATRANKTGGGVLPL